jgi:hypothetical protein
MKTSCGIVTSGFRLSLLTSIFVLACSGCVNTPAPQVARTAANAGHANTVAISTPSPIAPQSSPAGTPSPSSTLPVVFSGTAADQSTDIAVPDVVSEVIGQVDSDRTLTDLRKLTGETPVCNNNGCHTIVNRLTGGKELAWARDYVDEQLSRAGFSVEFDDWSGSGYTDQNLIARKTGISLPNEEIYFVAHVDGVKKFWSSRFPAADDNASGVVDLLELARVLSAHSFKRTVVLLFSTGEEQGELGVNSYISQLTPEELASIKYVVDVDMIGYDGNRDEVMELWHGGHPPSLALARLMSDTIKEYQLNLAPRFVVGCG